MASVKFDLRVSSKKSPDYGFIYLMFYYENRGQLCLALGEKIKVKDWDGHKPLMKSGRNDLAKLATRLRKYEQIMYDIYYDLGDQHIIPNNGILKATFDDLVRKKRKVLRSTTNALNEVIGVKPNNYMNFFDLGDSLVEYKKANGQAEKSLKTSLHKLKEFILGAKWKKEPDCNSCMDYEDFTLEWYLKYITWLNKKGSSKNYCGTQIKNVKLILNEAWERKYHNNLDYKSKKFAVLKEEVFNIYLTPEEVNDIYNLDYSDNKELDISRDIFVLGCYVGLRYSDLSRLTEANIKDKKYISMTTKKTHTKVIIPMNPAVKEILIKYNWNIPFISDTMLNKNVKKIGLKAKIIKNIIKERTIGGKHTTITLPKYMMIASHTARRTMATNYYNAGIPVKSIMSFTGHKTEKQFFTYVKTTVIEQAENLINHPAFTDLSTKKKRYKD